MKIQVDLNEQLWNDFKSKVQGEGKTLREVVPTLFEPALREYLDPPPHKGVFVEQIEKERAPTSNEFPESLPFKDPPPMPTVKRCELCDMPTERRFSFNGRKVCYTCWRDGIIAEGSTTAVSNSGPSEGPSPSSVSSPS